MEYAITIPKSEIAIPILLVVEVIAKHKATLGGTATYHNQTFKASYKGLCFTLLDEVKQKRLKICDHYGIEIPYENDTAELHEYFSSLEQLNDWGKGTHVFTRVDMHIDVVTFDRTDNKGSIQKNFHRGFIWDSAGLAISDLEQGITKKPLLQQVSQEQEILRVISELGYIATELPKNDSGKRGIKAMVNDKLVPKPYSTSVFNKAWERLRSCGKIQNI